MDGQGRRDWNIYTVIILFNIERESKKIYILKNSEVIFGSRWRLELGRFFIGKMGLIISWVTVKFKSLEFYHFGAL